LKILFKKEIFNAFILEGLYVMMMFFYFSVFNENGEILQIIIKMGRF